MKIKLVIPTTLNEVTLAQYMEFLRVAKDLEHEQLKEETIRHFCGVPLEYIRAMKSKDVNEIYGGINLLFQDEKKLIQEFKLKDIDFGFIPSLDDISHGEYVDLDKYIGDWEQINRAMAVLFRPITKRDKTKYSITQSINSLKEMCSNLSQSLDYLSDKRSLI